MASVARRLSTLLLVVVSSALAVLLAEGVLRLVLNPADFLHATLVDDPVLGHRIEPLTTGHDALGFRNREVPAQASVVAIGDSFTYGVSAPRDGSWPHQLAGLLGERVYNMGLGGYGPLQYVHLAQDVAKPLKPRLWVVGFYFGNDLMDAYYVAHGRPHWKDWRLSVRPSGQLTDFDRAGMAEPARRFAGLRDWLSRHSVLYSVLRATAFQRLGALEREQMAHQSAPDVQWVWSDPAQPGVRTVFTPKHRLAAIDLESASVNEGLQISKRALAAIQSEADQQGVKLLVALIPTKERAYCAHLKQAATPLPASHAKLCDAESRTKAELTRSLDEHKVRYVDVSSALEASIAQHVQVYPTDSDGHLQSTGYGVMARVIAEAVRHQQSKP
jgi:lysophospholipase L1-like esterase